MKEILQAVALFGKLGAVKNWKTTGIGLAAAILAVVYDLSVAGTWDKWTVIKALLAAASGFMAKDADKSGTVEVKAEPVPVSLPEGDSGDNSKAAQ